MEEAGPNTKDEDLRPTSMGHSVGHWEGDTLVVDATGFTDKTWLDREGHPHSDQLHLVERFRRIDHDTLQDDLYLHRSQGLFAAMEGTENI